MSLLPQNRTIVVGHTGQDGTLLLRDLRNRGDLVVGISRSGQISPLPSIPDVTVTDAHSVRALVDVFQPTQVYYLAAHHHSAELNESPPTLRTQYELAHATHVTGLLYFLDAITSTCPQARLFYASSSLVFSGENGEVQDENTPKSPSGIYGITKAQGMLLCHEFRTQHNIFASTGILYNHESHLRAPTFLTAKVIRAAIRIANGSDEKLEVGNLSAKVDWGYAPDYVNAFQRILGIDTAGDFVVGSGEAHSVSEFIEIVFSHLNIDPARHLVENKNKSLRSPLVKVANSDKLRRLTGWYPPFSFRSFVIQLVEDHIASMPWTTP